MTHLLHGPGSSGKDPAPSAPCRRQPQLELCPLLTSMVPMAVCCRRQANSCPLPSSSIELGPQGSGKSLWTTSVPPPRGRPAPAVSLFLFPNTDETGSGCAVGEQLGIDTFLLRNSPFWERQRGRCSLQPSGKVMTVQCDS